VPPDHIPSRANADAGGVTVPKSRSKRSRYIPPKPPKPKPSPQWVPWVGLGLVVLGLVVVIGTYLVPGFPGGSYALVLGFVFMAGGLVALSRWH
jgi:hypothetical protein